MHAHERIICAAQRRPDSVRVGDVVTMPKKDVEHEAYACVVEAGNSSASTRVSEFHGDGISPKGSRVLARTVSGRASSRIRGWIGMLCSYCEEANIWARGWSVRKSASVLFN
jgi:hypothetical protein